MSDELPHQSTPLPSAATIMRRAADQLEADVARGATSYASLASGVLGEACTSAEIAAVAGQPDLIRELVLEMRSSADRMEARDG